MYPRARLVAKLPTADGVDLLPEKPVIEIRNRAIQQALTLADRYQADLHAISVVDRDRYGEPALSSTELVVDELEDRARVWLAEISDEGDSLAVAVETKCCHGSPDTEIVSDADEIDADLTVLGSRGRSHRQRPIGSVADRVSRTADRPVLLVWAVDPLAVSSPSRRCTALEPYLARGTRQVTSSGGRNKFDAVVPSFEDTPGLHDKSEVPCSQSSASRYSNGEYGFVRSEPIFTLVTMTTESTVTDTDRMQDGGIVGGILLALLGVIALFTPFVTGLALTVVLGAVLVVGALVHVAAAFSARSTLGVLWQILLGIVYGIAGIAVLTNPLFGLTTLAVLVIAFFVAEGVIQLVWAATGSVGSRLGFGLSGAISLGLAVLIWAGLPSSALWAVGTLFGVNLLVTGGAMIFYSRRQRAAARDETPAGAGG